MFFYYTQILETVLVNPSFKELGIFNNFCICVNIGVCVLFVNMLVFNVNELVSSSNVLYSCNKLDLIQVVFSYTTYEHLMMTI